MSDFRSLVEERLTQCRLDFLRAFEATVDHWRQESRALKREISSLRRQRQASVLAATETLPPPECPVTPPTEDDSGQSAGVLAHAVVSEATRELEEQADPQMADFRPGREVLVAKKSFAGKTGVVCRTDVAGVYVRIDGSLVRFASEDVRDGFLVLRGKDNTPYGSSRKVDEFNVVAFEVTDNACSEPAVLHALWRGEPVAPVRRSADSMETTHSWVLQGQRKNVLLRGTMVQGINEVLRSNLPHSTSRMDLGSVQGSPGLVQCFQLMQPFMIHPGSNRCVFWDLMGALLIMWDVVLIPMDAFELQAQILDIMAFVILGYWSVDVILRFFVGYFDNGVPELHPRKVIKNFLMTWFLPDFIVVSVDWFFLIIVGGSQATRTWRLGRAARTIRLLRLIRLVRLLKFVTIVRSLLDHIQSEWQLLLTKALNTSVAVLVSVHYIACYWYFMGTHGNEGSGTESWVDAHITDPDDAGVCYFISTQWALAQSGLASTAIAPTTFLEYVYSVVVSLLWMVMLPAIIAHVSDWIHAVREDNAEYHQQENWTRCFLLGHRTTAKTTALVMRFVRMQYTKRNQALVEADIQVLQNLEPMLSVRLHQEMYMPFLRLHPALDSFCWVNTKVALSVCQVAMSERHMTSGQEIYCEGTMAKGMHFVSSGPLNYYLNGEDSLQNLHRLSTSQLPRSVLPGEWLCEAALWRPWVCRGTLSAGGKGGHVILLDERLFQAVLKECEEAGSKLTPLRSYARRVVNLFSDDAVTDLCEDPIAIKTTSEEAFAAYEGSAEYKGFRGMRKPFGKSGSQSSNVSRGVRGWTRQSLQSRSLAARMSMRFLVASISPSGGSERERRPRQVL